MKHSVYRAPEIILGRNYTEKADIYSLGLVGQYLFKMLDKVKYTDKLNDFWNNLTKLFVSMLRADNPQSRPSCGYIIKQLNECYLCLIRFDFPIVENITQNINNNNKNINIDNNITSEGLKLFLKHFRDEIRKFRTK